MNDTSSGILVPAGSSQLLVHCASRSACHAASRNFLISHRYIRLFFCFCGSLSRERLGNVKLDVIVQYVGLMRSYHPMHHFSRTRYSFIGFLLIALLATTVGYCAVLNRRLTRLRDGHSEFKALVRPASL